MDDYRPESGLQKVPVENLVLGMFIAGLDKPWLESSSPIQGFYLESTENIQSLASECTYVYVDPRRYDSRLVDIEFTSSAPEDQVEEVDSNIIYLDSIRPENPKIYSNTVKITDEMAPAQTSLEDAIVVMKSVVGKLNKSGSINCEEIESAIQPLVNSVMRNKMAIAALLRMRSLGEYSYAHALSCAVWTALLARELGFSKKEIDHLALGASLMDIGKLQLPIELINSTETLSDESWETTKSHVEEGVKLAREAGAEDQVLEMIQTHHERHDGSGYPLGLKANEIPVSGRIAAIVDSYDAMISDRPHTKALSSFEAAQDLLSNAHSESGGLYQKEIVEHFIKAIGVFPVGTIVELNDGSVGVVVSQNDALRLKPKVMLIMDEAKQIKNKFVVIDLAASAHEGRPASWISKELPTNAYGIDPGKYFL